MVMKKCDLSMKWRYIFTTNIYGEPPHCRVGRMVKEEIKLIIANFHVNLKQNICCEKEACAYT
jgi:hypothetical protein